MVTMPRRMPTVTGDAISMACMRLSVLVLSAHNVVLCEIRWYREDFLRPNTGRGFFVA